MNDDIFVAKGYEHIWASSGHRLKGVVCGCHIDVEARAYVRTACYAPEIRMSRTEHCHQERSCLTFEIEGRHTDDAYDQSMSRDSL